MKRFVTLLLCLCLSLTAVFSGCGEQFDDTESDLVKDLKPKYHIGDNISLSWYINLNWWSYTNEWRSYPVLNDVSLITGVTPKTQVATDSDGSKLGMLMVTDRLPDLITVSPDDPIVETLIKDGYVWALDDLMDQYCPEFKDIIDPQYKNDTAYVDGKLYGLNCFYQKDDSGLGATTFNVRKDIYEALGSPDMSTREGFLNTLRRVKNEYQMIPLTLGDSYYRFIFEECFGVHNYFEDANGDIKIRLKDPKFIDAMLFLNQLYREGLIDSEVFTKTGSKLHEDLAGGRIFCYPVTFWDLDTTNAALEQQKAGSRFFSVDPFQPLKEENPEYRTRFPGMARLGWMTTLVSKRCKNPEQVVKFMYFMFGKDGNMLVNYGYPDRDYSVDEEAGIVTRSDEVVERRKNDLTNFENQTGIFTQRMFYYPYYKDAPSTDPDRLQNERVAQQYVYDSTVFKYRMDPETTTAEGQISTKVWAKYNSAWPAMVVTDEGEAGVRRQLEAAIADMEKYGLSRLEAFWTKQFKANVERFGKPNID